MIIVEPVFGFLIYCIINTSILLLGALVYYIITKENIIKKVHDEVYDGDLLMVGLIMGLPVLVVLGSLFLIVVGIPYIILQLVYKIMMIGRK